MVKICKKCKEKFETKGNAKYCPKHRYLASHTYVPKGKFRPTFALKGSK